MKSIDSIAGGKNGSVTVGSFVFVRLSILELYPFLLSFYYLH